MSHSKLRFGKGMIILYVAVDRKNKTMSKRMYKKSEFPATLCEGLLIL